MLIGGREAWGREATLCFADKENETQTTDVLYLSHKLLKGEHGINNHVS